MKITLYGAAGDVTGSAYHVQTERGNVLVDCGIFQGGRDAELRSRKPPPIDYSRLDAVLLTHAHLDHTGRLPLVVKAGFNRPIYATPATIEMTSLVLHDSVKVQSYDLMRLNRKRLRTGLTAQPPLYGDEEVKKVEHLLRPIPYNESIEVAEGIRMRAVEAGHILGSVSIELSIKEKGTTKVVVFSGDLGPQGMAILKDPMPFRNANIVFLESTYGDRDHKSLKETLAEGEEIIQYAIANKGKILIPSFAIGRTQQLLYYIAASFHNERLSQFNVYVDSPMAIEATKIYLKHTELYDAEAMELLNSGHLKADLSHVKYVVTPEESMALNNVPGPMLIIAGAGMCNAGRILHHLRHNLWMPETSVVIVGYQGEGTLGRRLVEGATTITIFGEKIAVRAQIHKLGGLSAHAGQTDLLRWFDAIAPSRPTVVLSHGEDRGRIPLGQIIEQRYGIKPVLPEYGDQIEV
ncbi:MAG: MBL fold metallo-hydrolase [Bacteroidetes bacterium]|nr:MBL fold metallo-hydrolase [Bacteroidota bacterium]